MQRTLQRCSYLQSLEHRYSVVSECVCVWETIFLTVRQLCLVFAATLSPSVCHR